METVLLKLNHSKSEFSNSCFLHQNHSHRSMFFPGLFPSDDIYVTRLNYTSTFILIKISFSHFLKQIQMNCRKTHLSFSGLDKQVSSAWNCMIPSSWSLSELEDLSRSWGCCWYLGKFVFLFYVVTSQEEVCGLGVCAKQGILMQMKK